MCARAPLVKAFGAAVASQTVFEVRTLRLIATLVQARNQALASFYARAL